MKKITGFILMLCVMLTATGCNGGAEKNNEDTSVTTSQTDLSSEVEETTDAVITVQTEQTEARILKLDKKEFNNYEWSDEYTMPLVECEYSAILLGSEEAERYPELAKALSEIADVQEDNMKNEYDMLTESAKESVSFGAEGFNTLVSTLDTQVRRADNVVLSVLNDSYYYNGMNDGSRSFWGANYDTETGKELFLPDVVTDIDEFAKAVETKLFNTFGADVFHRDDIIKEYFEMYGADGTHWTLDYNGVTMYFDEGEIAGQGVGAMNVTVTFAEHPELFNEKYTEVPEAYIVALPMKSTFCTDLDGDGSCEELNVVDSYDAENDYYATVYISTPEVYYAESFWAYACEPYYVKTADGKNYLYLFAELETQMYLYVYDITSKTISKVGEVNVSPYYNDGISAVLTDPESMHFDIFSEEAGGGIPEGNDIFSIGIDGLPAQG